MNTIITTELHTYELDIDPYTGHVMVAVDGAAREYHFDTNVEDAVENLMAMVRADIDTVASRAPWVEV